MKRTIFIGDVHGCHDEMMKMLDAVRFSPEDDEIYFTGDLIGKGPNALKTVQTVEQNHFKSVLGNWEAHLLKYISVPQELWTDKIKRFFDSLEDPFWIANAVKKWPLWYDTPQALLVHAGLEPGKQRLENMNPNVLLSIRTWSGSAEEMKSPANPAWFECVTWSKPIVFGHWAAKGLVDIPGFHGLDSGCVYGKKLSAYCIEENRLYQIPAARIYSPIKAGKS